MSPTTWLVGARRAARLPTPWPTRRERFEDAQTRYAGLRARYEARVRAARRDEAVCWPPTRGPCHGPTPTPRRTSRRGRRVAGRQRVRTALALAAGAAGATTVVVAASSAHARPQRSALTGSQRRAPRRRRRPGGGRGAAAHVDRRGAARPDARRTRPERRRATRHAGAAPSSLAAPPTRPGGRPRGDGASYRHAHSPDASPRRLADTASHAGVDGYTVVVAGRRGGAVGAAVPTPGAQRPSHRTTAPPPTPSPTPPTPQPPPVDPPAAGWAAAQAPQPVSDGEHEGAEREHGDEQEDDR